MGASTRRWTKISPKQLVPARLLTNSSPLETACPHFLLSHGKKLQCTHFSKTSFTSSEVHAWGMLSTCGRATIGIVSQNRKAYTTGCTLKMGARCFVIAP